MLSRSRKLDIVFVAILSIVLLFGLGFRVGYTWTGNTNTLSPGFLEVNEVNATGYYWNSANRTILLSGQNATGATAYVGFDSNLDYLPNYWLCDGVTDDIQIQSAINYTGNLGGGSVYLENVPIGINYYDITTEIVDYGYNNITIQGVGDNCVLRVSNGIQMNIFHLDGVSGWKFHLFKMDGNKANILSAGFRYNQNGIFLENLCEDIIIENINIIDTVFNGILVGDETVKYAGPDGIIISNSILTNCGKTGAGADGILGRGALNVIVDSCEVRGSERHNIRFDGSKHIIIDECITTDAVVNDGICLYNSDNCTISNNIVLDNYHYGIVLARYNLDTIRNGPNTHISIVGNIVEGGDTQAINVGSGCNATNINKHITIVANVISNGTDGIQITFTTDTIISSNTISMVSDDGIEILGGPERIIVSSNKIGDVGGDGLYAQGEEELLIIGNYIYNSGRDGIRIKYVDDAIISNNILESNTGYGVYVENPTSYDNTIKNNKYVGNTAGAIYDEGGRTQLHTLTLSFVDGTQFNSTNSKPWGWQIDAGGEYTLITGALPLEVQEVVRWKIWATSLVTEIDGMKLEIVGRGGASNEPYTIESIDIANNTSTTTNFNQFDEIYWTLAASDDPDLDDMVGGDTVMIKILHEVAAGADCATEATFLCVEIEYV